MRVDLVREDVLYPGPRRFLPDSITWWGEFRVPIFSRTTRIEGLGFAGWANAFQRSEDLVISCDIGALVVPTRYSLSFASTDFEAEMTPDGVYEVSKARIRDLIIAETNTIPTIHGKLI